MATKYFDAQQLNFVLFDLLQAEQLNRFDFYVDHDRQTMEMVLDAAQKLADKNLQPWLQAMDKEAPIFENGQIKVHPQVKKIIRDFAEGGWISAVYPYEEGGQQLPYMLSFAASYIFGAANYSASVYPYLTSGAANLIRNFASRELKEKFIPNMFAGKWQGTMALTEPEAGSSLSDITTTAYPTDKGYYLIKGQKIFISAGDHDAVENIVHLMLARIEGAPKGTKGISLFIVPKRRLENGELVNNDVTTAGVFHKMGYKGAPIAHLILGEKDDCQAYLVGEPHQGLSYMFQMMNEARVGVGLNAVSIASAAYQASLAYAKERKQGRLPNKKDVTQEQVKLTKHADIKRLLLMQKAMVEGSLAILMQCALYTDLERVATGKEKEHAALLLDLLTPVAKSYPAENGCLSTSAAIQIMGGYGYCSDFPVEQFYREARIHPIHEGTTGIHALDLLGRKVWLKESKAFQLFLAEVNQCIENASGKKQLQHHAQQLKVNLRILKNTTMLLGKVFREKGSEFMLADASLYLDMFGIITMAWQWLKIGLVAVNKLDNAQTQSQSDFLEGKIYTLHYFYEYELPKVSLLAQRLADTDYITMHIEEQHF